MSKFYSLLIAFVCFLSSIPIVNAQSVTIEGSGTSASYLYSPFYTYNAAPRSYRSAFIYSQSLLSTMPSGSIINQLQFSRAADGVSLPAGNNLKLYLMNTNQTDWGSTSLPWDVSNAVLVYDGDPAAIIGSTSGYKTFPLMQSFTYTGGNLALFSEYSQVNAPASAITWHYNTSTTQPAYTANQVKYSSSSTNTMPTSLGSSTANHANMIIEYSQAGPCTSPPAAGAATANPATAICSGTTVSLTLTGNSSGTGQTYQWQQSSTPGGPYTDVDTSSSSAFITVTPTATTYYRAAVTCSGVTSYSTEVEVVVNPLVSGTFTINNGMPTGSGNFQTFAEAVNYIKCGINGPVVFNVANSVYNEQVVIPQIQGASATNTITFKGNLATISFNSTTSTARTGITLNGADYIRLDSLNIDATSGTYGWGILLTNRADHNIISNCTINTSTSSTSSNYAGIAISGSVSSLSSSGNNGNYNIIKNNTVTGGYYGISAYGSTNPYNQGNEIRNNTITDYYYYSIYSYGNENITISKNRISRPTRSTVSSYNLYLSSTRGALVEKNRIFNLYGGATSNTSTLYNIYVASSGTDTSINRIENNLTYDIVKAGGTNYGIYSPGYNYINFYHNTIVFDDQSAASGNTYGIYAYGTAMNVKNNIIYITRGGTGTNYGVYYSTTGVTTSNHNVFYINGASGTNYIGYHSSAYATLAAWQAGSAGYDQQSVAEDPMFVAAGTGDYVPSQPNINNIGDSVGVATDILDSVRLITAPDPGAYEFQLAGCTNPPVAGMVSPSTTVVCAGAEFTLDLVGNSIGEHQYYQWQVSSDNINFTNIGNAQPVTTYVTSQTANSYYRAVVTCNNGTPVYSDTVLIATPAFVSGTYTINSAMPTGSLNFQSFTEAINHIKCGINGPVVFNVEPGTSYFEQVIIPEIVGTSATNTITINGNGAMISYTSMSGSERAVIKLDGADYVTIDSLMITATGSATNEYGYGVHLVNNADHNAIINSTIMATTSPATASSSAFAGIVINAATGTSPVSTGDAQSDSNYIAHNRITGGYVGVSIVGSGTTYKVYGNVVAHNIIEDFYIYGVYLNGNEGTVVEGNDIGRPTRNSVSTFYGVYMSTGTIGAAISRNIIHDAFTGNTSSTSAAYGVYTSGSDATAANPTVISNNMIHTFNNSGTQYGFYNSSSDSVLYYYNSVLLDGQATTSTTYTTRGFYQTTAATGLEYKNNIVYISRASIGQNQAIYFATSTTTFTSNHNNFYIATASGSMNNVGYANGTQYQTLADWQTGTSQDANSLSIDPMFIAYNDLHLAPGSPMDDKGTAVGIGVDIDGDVRDANLPDIGADEMPLSQGIDLQSVRLVSPTDTTNCVNDEVIAVEIKNNSVSPIDFTTNQATVTVNVSGTTSATYTAVIDSGTLASGASRIVTMKNPSSTINMSTPGGYTFNGSVAVSNDVNTANNILPSVTVVKLALAAGTITATPSEFCMSGKPSLKVSNAQGYSALQWQRSSTSGSGFTDIADANDTLYKATADITETTYYRLVATCGTSTVTSPELAVVVNKPEITSTTPDARCGAGQVTLQATSNAGYDVLWYRTATASTPLHTGSTFTTNVDSNTTYYVAASSGYSTGTVGAPDPSIGSSTTVGGYYLNFTVHTSTIIESVNAYFNTVGSPFTIEIRDSATKASVFTYSGTTAYSGTTTPQTIPLNASLTPGVYQIGFTTDPGTYRNSTGASYPYTLPGVISITSNTFNNANYYYYFYQWVVRTGCSSARTAVEAKIDECTTPVTLVNFSGYRSGDVNKLTWSTATEQDNAGFELQRSADGVHFSKLNYVASKAIDGNSNAMLTYSADDVKPLPGNSYYRLKQIDKDGVSTLSNVVLIRGSRVEVVTLGTVYPNPVKHTLSISVASPVNESVKMIITDLSGKVVMQSQTQLVSGDNKVQLQVQHLSSGTYIIRALCANGCESAVQKFVKD